MRIKQVEWQEAQSDYRPDIITYAGFCGEQRIATVYRFPLDSYWIFVCETNLIQNRKPTFEEAKQAAETAFRESITAKYNELKHFIEE